MANPPPRKFSSSSKTSKQDATPLQILLQMGFPKNRALKALAATGNRSVQLASDWLLMHVNDIFIDADLPREYIFYASPVGPLLTQLHEFWEKSKAMGNWNGAHNFPPHITLVSFFKAADEASLQLAKAVKQVVEMVGNPPTCQLKLEPYISHNFMGLFISEEHAEYLKKIAVQFVKEVSSILGVKVDTYEHLDALGACFPWCTMAQEKDISTNLEAHVKSLHITLAYHFEASVYDGLKKLVEELKPEALTSWELRLYSRDPRFANHLVHKVTQAYVPEANDELELVIGDYIYIEEKQFDSSQDGWVQGTSWLTGVSGYLPAVYTQRTAESDAWTLHRAISLGNKLGTDSKSESFSTSVDMTSYPHEDSAQLGLEKSEETYKDWETYWKTVQLDKTDGVLNVIQGSGFDWKSEKVCGNGDSETTLECKGTKEKIKANKERRWIFALRHGERVDLTYGVWIPFCFDGSGKYIRKDLNMPIKLGDRKGGKESYALDTPLTRVGQLQAQLVGEGLRAAGVRLQHVYASCALRCVETAHALLQGLQADPSVKIRVEPGLFEYKMWHLAKGMAPFMTPRELHDHGLNVDLDYKPYVNLEINTPETLEDFYNRNELVFQSAVKDKEEEGGNIIFVGHAATLDEMVLALKRLAEGRTDEANYQISQNLLRVPYCALAAMRDQPWEVVSPPCPPSINSSSGRYNWKMLLDIHT